MITNEQLTDNRIIEYEAAITTISGPVGGATIQTVKGGAKTVAAFLRAYADDIDQRRPVTRSDRDAEIHGVTR